MDLENYCSGKEDCDCKYCKEDREMSEVKRLSCGAGDGMYESKDGYYTEYSEVERLQEEVEKRNEIILALLGKFSHLQYQNIIDKKEGKEVIDRLHKLYVKSNLNELERRVLEGWKKPKRNK